MAYYDNGILYVDNTTLSSMVKCPTHAVVRYGYNLKPRGWQAAPLESGIAIHNAIEVHYQGGRLHEVLEVFDASYYDYATHNQDANSRYGFTNVRECVESWCIRHPLDKLPYTIPDASHVEMPFDLQLHPRDPSIRYVGRLDALVARKATRQMYDMDGVPDGVKENLDPDALYVLDTKSTGQPWGDHELQFDLSPQMSGYVWAARQLFPNLKVVGVYINVVHTYMIPRDSGKCTVHKVDKSECRFLHPRHQLYGPKLRGKGELRQWRADAYQVAKAWKEMLDDQLIKRNLDNVPQTGKWIYRACTLCELHEFCKGGRRMDAYDFEQDEWIPGDLAERKGEHVR